MRRLCFDYGHGGKDSGAFYKGRKESDDVLKIGREVASEVERHGVIVDETRTCDNTVSLKARSSFANKKDYDYFISFHRNAYQPEKTKGAETFIYLHASSKSEELAKKVQAALVSIGFNDRGVKKANFHVLRETKAPAILIEIGFLDNTEDNKLFDSKRNEIIKAITKAILAQLGIDYIEKSTKADSKTLYRVQVGSYVVKENAEKQVQRLKDAGFDAITIIYNR